jgi:hypothetical protein
MPSVTSRAIIGLIVELTLRCEDAPIPGEWLLPGSPGDWRAHNTLSGRKRQFASAFRRYFPARQ